MEQLARAGGGLRLSYRKPKYLLGGSVALALLVAASGARAGVVQITCSGTQTATKDDVKGSLQLPWSMSYLLDPKSGRYCAGSCDADALFGAPLGGAFILRSLEDSRGSTPLTISLVTGAVAGLRRIETTPGNFLQLSFSGACSLK